jgi:antirestriction protein ArdC
MPHLKKKFLKTKKWITVEPSLHRLKLLLQEMFFATTKLLKGGTKMKKENKKDIYQEVTDRMIESLGKGVIPWKKSWALSFNGHTSGYRNYLTGKTYRGINPFLLYLTAEEKGFKSDYWLTYSQCKAKKGNIKKGEKGTTIVFWKWLEKKETNEDGQEEISNIPVIKYYTVFNLDQTTLEDSSKDNKQPELVKEINKIKACENVVKSFETMPLVKYGNPPYSPTYDFIYMPEMSDFNTGEEYYSTLFHEMVHSTGHHSRLNREAIEGFNFFGSEKYSKEELVAEMGACFLANKTGIETKVEENQVAYIQSWLKKLKNDKRLIISAAATAQKAVDYILDEQIQE